MESRRTFTIVVTGLGGQGILLLSKAIASAGFSEFAYVCRTETRGLSQRGGSVQSIVRFGSWPVTAVVDEGSADLVIALETLESVRSLPLLKESGTLVASASFLPPANLVDHWKGLNAQESESEFRAQLRQQILERAGAYIVDAMELASPLQSPKAANVVLLGAASHFLPLAGEALKSALLLNVKSEFREVNAKAFDAGRHLIQSRLSAKLITA